MGLFTTVTTIDSDGNGCIWQFKHGLDQCEHYRMHEPFGWEVEYHGGQYDVDGVYDAVSTDTGWHKFAIVVVRANAVVEVVPVEWPDLDFNVWRTPEMLEMARSLAAKHDVEFNFDDFGY